MSKFYVVGGRQKRDLRPGQDEWQHYEAGLIVAVDSETGETVTCVEYVSPSDACASQDDPSIVFKTATLAGNRMYVPTQTELLLYTVPSFERIGYVSLPCFNDVHHVTPGSNGTLFVADTGLDMVLELEADGRVVKEWSVTGEELWRRFSRDVDYRKVVTTKPHHAHPNHVFFLNGEVWATRCDQRDIVCLSREREPVCISQNLIHDGLVHDGRIYFTAVTGEVAVLDAESLQVSGRYDLNEIAGSRTPLGWCRGLEVIDEAHVVVGFSRLRPTRWKEKVHWVKHRLGGDGRGLLPTRLMMFDLRRGAVCWKTDLEPAGMNAVFSVHSQPEQGVSDSR